MKLFSWSPYFKSTRTGRKVLAFFLSLQMVGSYSHAGNQDPYVDGQSIKMQIMDPQSNKVDFTLKVEAMEVNAIDLPVTLHNIAERNATTTIFSSDRDDILLQAEEEASRSSNKNKKQYIVPLGKAIKGKVDGVNAWITQFQKESKGYSAQDKALIDQKSREYRGNPAGLEKWLSEYFVDYKNNLKTAAKVDPVGLGIGLAIITWNQGVDTVQWMTASDLSNRESLAAVAYSIATTLILSVDRTAWSKATGSIQKVIRKGLKMGEIPAGKTNFSDVAVKLGASVALMTALNYGRIPFAYVDHILEGTMDPINLIKPLALSVGLGLAAAGWMETVGKIDREKNPNARFWFERAIDGRGFLVGTFASTAMLFDFEKFGLNPWLTLGGVGAAGVATFVGKKQLIEALEKIPNFTNLFKQVSQRRGSSVSGQCVRILIK